MGAALAGSLTLSPSIASAAGAVGEGAEVAGSAPPDPVVVTLRARHEPLFVELYHPSARVRTDPPIARCTTPCFARLSPGRYRLFVHETAGTLAGGRLFELRESTAIVISPDQRSQRTAGLALGIGGSVAAVAGAVLVLSSLCIEQCQGQHNDAGAGLLLMGGGLVAIPIGWTMFGRSFKPDLMLTPLPSVQERRLDARWGAPFAGLRLGLSVAF